jgi:uncharacterized protein YfiM (DUF2279 family)
MTLRAAGHRLQQRDMAESPLRAGRSLRPKISNRKAVRSAGFLIIALLAGPPVAAAQDRWLGRDKAKHFGAMAAIGAGGYALATPLTEQDGWRMVIGTTAGIGAAAAKEVWDRSHGNASWRDLAWGAAGTTAGVLIARTIVKAWR